MEEVPCVCVDDLFLLTPLREGRPTPSRSTPRSPPYFYSRPCGRGDGQQEQREQLGLYFYSRPCGRGDYSERRQWDGSVHFYSRPCGRGDNLSSDTLVSDEPISTHAPAGGATDINPTDLNLRHEFLLTPLREGRPAWRNGWAPMSTNFYSRPCGRGDPPCRTPAAPGSEFLLTPLREGRREHHAADRPPFAVFLLTPLREGRQQFSTSPS